MKDKIKNIAEKLEHQIRMHELDLNDRIKDIPQIILLLEQGFSELKEIVSFYKFKSEMDEIFFFKIIKPKFFSKLIYYRKVYNIEMMRPNGQDCVLKNYFINELNQLENFYNKNIDFYKYYRSGSTHLDKYFFLRGKQDIQMTMETFYFERDPNFSTICDFKVAKIVANEMLRIYLNFIMNGANHRMDGITTYPFNIFGCGWEKVTPTIEQLPFKGDTVIGNDVWICQNVTIMPGVKIGDGAIIAANSTVVKSVEPYSIYGGNPAKFIKKRFSDEKIEFLLKLEWWNWSEEEIFDNLEILTSEAGLEELMNKYSKRDEIN